MCLNFQIGALEIVWLIFARTVICTLFIYTTVVVVNFRLRRCSCPLTLALVGSGGGHELFPLESGGNVSVPPDFFGVLRGILGA